MTNDTPPTKRTIKPKASRLRPTSPGVAAAGDNEPPASASPTPPTDAGVPQFAPTIEQLEHPTAPQPVPTTPQIIEPPREQLDVPIPILGTPFNVCDIVQVILVPEQPSRYVGMCFILGDIKHGKAHGFYFHESGKKEFLTVPENQIYFIGRAKVRARVNCSPKWIADNS